MKTPISEKGVIFGHNGPRFAMPQFRLTLYQKAPSSYSSTLPELSQLLESLKAKYDTNLRIILAEQLTAESERELKTSLRDLSPQKRGDIVTSRGNMLPLSAKKNLNLNNTPILLVEKNGIPIDVFPKRTEDQYRDVKEGMLQMLGQGIELKQDLTSAEEIASGSPTVVTTHGQADVATVRDKSGSAVQS